MERAAAIELIRGLVAIRSTSREEAEASSWLVSQMRAAGFEPEAYTLYSYAAVQIIADAAKAAGENDPTKVAEAAKAKGPFTTAIGEIGFDEKGDITRPDYVMYKWGKGDDGKYTYTEM